MHTYLIVFIKGIVMGAADVVPGVSGGTIALITGIYERLLNALKSASPQILLVWKDQGFKVAWQVLDGNFLLALLMGVAASVLTLAGVITYLLDHHTHLLWAFFFGLILISALVIGKQIERWSVSNVFLLSVASIVAFCITQLSPTSLEPTPLLFFLSGALAICAMILPGISGSFILLLLGMYGPVLGAIKSLDLMVVSTFSMGCIAGLLGFSHVMSWLFSRYRTATLATMTGFLLGSLSKVWPWKETLSTRINSHGEAVPLMQGNVSPEQFLVSTQQEPQVLYCVVLALVGVGLVWVLDRISRSQLQD